tara:strand:+ start:1838 stop:2410 length:573 start_codon:yes stop_codon:yes gene_type:complete
MSKKTLLNETTVRRFMKLANMGTLSDNFVNEGAYGMHQEDEPDLEEGHGMGMAYQDDEPVDMDEPPEAPEDMGPEEEPMPEEEPEMDADEVEISEDDRAALAAAIPVLEKIAGGAADADMGMDMGMDEPMPEGPMADEEEPMMEGEHAKEDDKKEDEKLDEVEVVEEDELVQEVTRRVAARLRAAMKSRK